jgi:hypothetical protein
MSLVSLASGSVNEADDAIRGSIQYHQLLLFLVSET